MNKNTTSSQRFSYSKNERLKKRSEIELLFNHNTSIIIYPFRIVYRYMPSQGHFSVKTGVSVSKKNFKHAVTRNLIKRRMREAFRLNKHTLYEQLPENVNLLIMMVYTGKEIEPLQMLLGRMKKALPQLAAKYSENE